MCKQFAVVVVVVVVVVCLFVRLFDCLYVCLFVSSCRFCFVFVCLFFHRINSVTCRLWH